MIHYYQIMYEKPIFHSSALSKTLNEKLYLMWQVSKSVDEYEAIERMELN